MSDIDTDAEVEPGPDPDPDPEAGRDVAPGRFRPPPRVLLLVSVAVLAAGLAAAFLVDWGGDDDPGPDNRFRVTETSNGADLTVTRGQQFVVRLQGSVEQPWTLPEATIDSMARITTETLADGSAAATFLPLEPIAAVIVAERVPLCADDTPPCSAPVTRFQVTIRVVP